jgi:branched-chain amino acid transport system substrate-binding protein
MRKLLVAFCALLVASAQGAEPGVTGSAIVLGQSAAFTGPAAQLGLDMNAGARAYFKTINDSGGVHGRRIELLTRDDAYNPDRAEENTRAFIEQDNVFALFGYVGTATSTAALPTFSGADVPFIAPVTGESSMREPFNRSIFNMRASYVDETEKLVEHLYTIGIHRIAVFYQNDAYGYAGLDGVNRAMAKRKLLLVASSSADTNSVEVTRAGDALMADRPDAIIQICSYSTCAALIKAMRARGYGGQFLNVSFVNGKALLELLGPQALGVIVSQVVPFPWGATIPLQREYTIAMKQLGVAELGFGSMEGFIAAKVFVEALRRAGINPTRTKLVTALEGMTDFDVSGFKVSFDPKNHAGSRFVDITLIGRGGRFVR